jgi:hypothetical protein
LKKLKGITTLLNDSSQYWKSTFDNIACNCNMENIIEVEKEEDIVVDKINYNTDYPISSNDDGTPN